MYLSSACSALTSVVRLGDFDNIITITDKAAAMKDEGATAVFSRYLVDLASTLLPLEDPRRWLLCAMGRLREEQLAMLSPVLYKLVAEEAETLIGEFNLFTIHRRLAAWRLDQSSEVVRNRMTRLLSNIERRFGETDLRTIWVLNSIANISFADHEDATYEKEFRHILERLSLRVGEPFHGTNVDPIYYGGVRRLATVQHAQGDCRGAIETLRSGLASAEHNGDRIIVCRVLDDLERYSRIAGDLHEADQIRERRLALLSEDMLS